MSDASFLAVERVPCVSVVSSHRGLGHEHGKPQQSTLLDEAGSRTLVSLGLQPMCYTRVPAARLPLLALSVEGVLLGGSATNMHPRQYAAGPAAMRCGTTKPGKRSSCRWSAYASSTVCP